MGRYIDVPITPAVEKSVEAAGNYIRDLAKGYAPVRTGALRDSITSDIEYTQSTIRAIVGPHVFYAEFVEYGTKRMSAQPFMRPALDEGRSVVLDLFRSNIGVSL